MKAFRGAALALFALAFLFALCGAPARARAEAENLTPLCKITSRPGKLPDTLRDGKYHPQWVNRCQTTCTLKVAAPRGKPIGSVYIRFGKLPKKWQLQIPEGPRWKTVHDGNTQLLHLFVELPEVYAFRLLCENVRGSVIINELTVFGPGEVPGWVQKWEPTPEKADLLVLVAHPDDELLFLGGTIPTYALEQRRKVLVAYLANTSSVRSSELLDGLWHMGVRQYPLISAFADKMTSTLAQQYARWGRERTYKHVMALIRKYKPEVMVTLDLNGEYGHGAHRACADAAIYCAQHAADPAVLPESAEAYGAWTLKKLYLHLGLERPIVMDWRVPLARAGGKTALELAQEAYLFHQSQLDKPYKVLDGGPHNCAAFGLAYTAVGDDVARDDFFENIPPD